MNKMTTPCNQQNFSSTSANSRRGGGVKKDVQNCASSASWKNNYNDDNINPELTDPSKINRKMSTTTAPRFPLTLYNSSNRSNSYHSNQEQDTTKTKSNAFRGRGPNQTTADINFGHNNCREGYKWSKGAHHRKTAQNFDEGPNFQLDQLVNQDGTIFDNRKPPQCHYNKRGMTVAPSNYGRGFYSQQKYCDPLEVRTTQPGRAFGHQPGVGRGSTPAGVHYSPPPTCSFAFSESPSTAENEEQQWTFNTNSTAFTNPQVLFEQTVGQPAPSSQERDIRMNTDSFPAKFTETNVFRLAPEKVGRGLGVDRGRSSTLSGPRGRGYRSRINTGSVGLSAPTTFIPQQTRKENGGDYGVFNGTRKTEDTGDFYNLLTRSHFDDVTATTAKLAYEMANQARQPPSGVNRGSTTRGRGGKKVDLSSGFGSGGSSSGRKLPNVPPPTTLNPEGSKQKVFNCDIEAALEGFITDNGSACDTSWTESSEGVRSPIKQNETEVATSNPKKTTSNRPLPTEPRGHPTSPCQRYRTQPGFKPFQQRIKISHTVGAEEFYVVLISQDGKGWGLDRKLLRNIHYFTQQDLVVGRPCAVEVDGACLLDTSIGSSSSNSSVWHRGQIESVDSGKNMVQILLVDVGSRVNISLPSETENYSSSKEKKPLSTVGHLPIYKLKSLPNRCAKMPPMAYKCRLLGAPAAELERMERLGIPVRNVLKPGWVFKVMFEVDQLGPEHTEWPVCAVKPDYLQGRSGTAKPKTFTELCEQLLEESGAVAAPRSMKLTSATHTGMPMPRKHRRNKVQASSSESSSENSSSSGDDRRPYRTARPPQVAVVPRRKSHIE